MRTEDTYGSGLDKLYEGKRSAHDINQVEEIVSFGLNNRPYSSEFRLRN